MTNHSIIIRIIREPNTAAINTIKAVRRALDIPLLEAKLFVNKGLICNNGEDMALEIGIQLENAGLDVDVIDYSRPIIDK